MKRVIKKGTVGVIPQLRSNDAYSPFTEHLAGGRSSGMHPSDFDPGQLRRGVGHELEHTDDPAIAEEIAMDHLAEDPAYYDHLAAMEQQTFRANPELQPGSIRHFSLILTGLLTQYDMAETKRELKRGHSNIYRLGLLFQAAQKAFDQVEGMAERSDPEALGRYVQALRKHFGYESPRRGSPPEFGLSPLRKLDKMMREWVESGKRPKYPVQKAAAHEPNASYYVWPVASDGVTPLAGEGPYGPHDLQGAKTYARIAATQGAHNRAVSRGLDPRAASFEIVRVYRHGTGERLV